MAARSRRYFQAGGTLRPNIPSYVERPADRELLAHVLEGEFCYVLTPRQMGKSSLMIRTARRLEEKGVKTVVIDLTGIGTVRSDYLDIWYLGLLSKIRQDLGVSLDPAGWWREQEIPAPQRFVEFLRQIVKNHIAEPIVIFIDEIDSTINLDFRDDFFAAIRAIFNERARTPEFEQVTFVLLGVASPTDLIKDKSRTPFNIGHEIALLDFSKTDADPLVVGLAARFSDDAPRIFDRLYDWTGGHPYLTQNLCVDVVNSKRETWSDQEIDALVRQKFISDSAEKDTNIQFVSDLVLSSTGRSKKDKGKGDKGKEQLLRLYKKIRQGHKVADDRNSQEQNRLKLSGLIEVDNGYLAVRNRIYHEIFDQKWISDNQAADVRRYVTMSLGFMLALVAIILIYESWARPAQATGAFETLARSSDSQERVAAMQTIFCQWRTPGLGRRFDEDAFDAISLNGGWRLQGDLFSADYHADNPDCLVKIVNGMFVTLTDDDMHESTWLLQEMQAGLEAFPDHQPARDLAAQIELWRRGRAAMQAGEYNQAAEIYTVALGHLHPQAATFWSAADKAWVDSLEDPVFIENQAILFERGQAHTLDGNFEGALDDFESILSNAPVEDVAALPTIEPTSTVMATATATTTTAAPEAVATQPEVVATRAAATVEPAAAVTSAPQIRATPLPVPTRPPTSTATPRPLKIIFHRPGIRWGLVRDFVLRHPPLLELLTATTDPAHPNFDFYHNLAAFILPDTLIEAAENMTAVPATPAAVEEPVRDDIAIPLFLEDAVFAGHEGVVTAIEFTPDGTSLASASTDGTIRLWHRDTVDPAAAPLVLNNGNEVLDLAFSPDGRTLAAGLIDGTIRVWNFPAGQTIIDLEEVSRPVGGRLAVGDGRDVGFRPQGSRAPEPDAPPRVLSGHDGPVRSLDISPDGLLLASGGEDGTVRLWDLADLAAEPVLLPGHVAPVQAVVFSPDSQTLASASDDRTIVLWNHNDLAGVPQIIAEHEDLVLAVAFSPDGEMLASGSADQTVRLWSLSDEAGTELGIFSHDDWVRAVAFSPDGNMLATASEDQTVRLWEITGVDPAANPIILSQEVGALFDLAFSPDGQALAAGASDGGVWLWDLTGRLFEVILGADLTREATAAQATQDASSQEAACEPTGDDPGGISDSSFLADVTIPDGTIMDPGDDFEKIWRVRNNGETRWGDGFCIVFVEGDQISSDLAFPIPPASPGEAADIAIPLTLINFEGDRAFSDWRLADSEGNFFGDILSINVAVGGFVDICEPNDTILASLSKRICRLEEGIVLNNLNLFPSTVDTSDFDFYQFNILERGEFRCETFNLSVANDTVMTVLDGNDLTLGSNDDKSAEDLGSLVEFFAEESGPVTIFVGPGFEDPVEADDGLTYDLVCERID